MGQWFAVCFLLLAGPALSGHLAAAPASSVHVAAHAAAQAGNGPAEYARACLCDPEAPAWELQVFRAAHFEIRAYPADVCRSDALELARQMEGRFAAYNRVFRFDSGRLAAPLRVRAFGDAALYESHVAARILGEAPTGAVYLHFAQAELRELVVHLGAEAEALPFQAFVQFLRAFVSNPPPWIRDGFGVHFGALYFGADGAAEVRENLAWVDAVRGMEELPAPGEIMLAAAPAQMENFPGLAWSLASFFVNSGDGNHIRSLTESFMLLSYAGSAEENAAAVAGRIAMWNDMDELARDHRAYVASRSSFAELVAQGQRAYEMGLAREAEAAFRRAIEMRPGHYAPWYYLGLLAFDAGDQQSAERYYRAALDLGADAATVLYALALNAATAGRIDEAIYLLRRSAQIAPARFGERAEDLVRRLEGIR